MNSIVYIHYVKESKTLLQAKKGDKNLRQVTPYLNKTKPSPTKNGWTYFVHSFIKFYEKFLTRNQIQTQIVIYNQ